MMWQQQGRIRREVDFTFYADILQETVAVPITYRDDRGRV